MLDYNLCRQLKEAGFPQHESHCGEYHCCKDQECFLPTLNGSMKPEEYPESICNPTLEELIDACGDEFNSLIRFKEFWQAKGFTTVGHGLTPEEAVANLWLAIQIK